MKSGKAPVPYQTFPVGCLKKGGMAVLEWLVGLLIKLKFRDGGCTYIYGLASCLNSAPVQREG